MANIVPVRSRDDWRALCASGRPVVLLKHSTACPTSAAAHRVFEAWAASLGPDAPTPAMVRVREERALSQEIARDSGVAHASPQVLVLRHGRAVGSLTHGAIRADAIAALVARARSGPA